MRLHILEHHIAAAQAVLGIELGIVGACSLEESHKHSRLLGVEVAWLHIEVGLCGSLDAIGVAAEIHGVGIHGENLLLGVEHFKLHGKNPLLALHDDNFQSRHLAEQAGGILRAHTEHILHKLLSDGRSTAGTTGEHILCGSKKSLEVDAMVAIETLVFGVDKSLEEDWINIGILHRGAVLVEILANHHAIGTVEHRSGARLRIHDAVDSRRLSE